MGKQVDPLTFGADVNLLKYTSHAPAWLLHLLRTTFFSTCSIHADSNKSECNQYCLDCMGAAFCPSCMVSHKEHHVIQIRRSSYHDVVRVSEIQRMVDLSGIQSYIINSARVVFINGRPQLRHGKGVTNNCEICDRSLRDTFRFCSLGCKLAGIIRHHPEMTFLLERSKPAHNVTSNNSSGGNDKPTKPSIDTAEAESNSHFKRPRTSTIANACVKMKPQQKMNMMIDSSNVNMHEDEDSHSSLSSETTNSTYTKFRCNSGEHSCQMIEWGDVNRLGPVKLGTYNHHKTKYTKLSPTSTLRSCYDNPPTFYHS
ncbi:hypothetical protein KP509_04G033700 [Ceratopteris richardii]|uniref:PLATZ transcription factor family protein n=1 Tax=Ceratopteris richardii TaxID=49495 RepID=A0A8T2UU70_CERRI|nr:hypothetical protein KP509_04G033700 [Ceratopteris richardii]